MKLVLTFSAVLLSVTCWALTFADYPAKSAKECAVSAEDSNVHIGVQAVESHEAQDTYFRAHFAKKGFVPVFVVIENAAADSIIFDRTKVRYGAAELATSAPRTDPGFGKMLAVSAIPFIGGVAGGQMISDASEVRENLLKKEIQSTTLSPGAATRGFLYIPIPKKGPRGKIALRIPITRVSDGNSSDVNLVL